MITESLKKIMEGTGMEILPIILVGAFIFCTLINFIIDKFSLFEKIANKEKTNVKIVTVEDVLKKIVLHLQYYSVFFLQCFYY